MSKPGDIQMIFGNPAKCIYPIGQARLIEKLSETEILEQWQIEYLDDEGRFYTTLIKKTNGTNEIQST